MNISVSEKFNALPKRIRLIFCIEEAQSRINQIKIDKDKMKRGYDKAWREMDAHQKSLEQGVLCLEKELETIEAEAK